MRLVYEEPVPLVLDEQAVRLDAEFEFAGRVKLLCVVEEGVEHPLLDETRDRLYLRLLYEMLDTAETAYLAKYETEL